MTRHLLAVLPAFILLPAFAQEAKPAAPATPAAADKKDAKELPTVVVDAQSTPTVQDPFLPAVEGTKINSGKKASVIDLDALPDIANNNYRQALAKTPGLYLEEEVSSSRMSLGYRGLAPHRSQFMQILKDGIPIHADQFGYPEAYYTPPLDTVDRLEFTRGGGALQYGPQPGGVVNFITHQPRMDTELAVGTGHTVGSNGLYSTFNYLEGTQGRIGYYGYFNHRQGDGPREANSGFNLNEGHVKLAWDAATDSRWFLTMEDYSEEQGEPGGLTAAGYKANRNATTRQFDLFKLDRTAASLRWEKDLGENTKLETALWGSDYQRRTWRQRGGGFGTLPTGAQANSNSIENQRFYNLGLESRIRHDYEGHTFAGGMQVSHTRSPRKDYRGAAANATEGALRNDSLRQVSYASLFAENKFTFGKLSITPGVRLENIWQGVDEKRNLDKTGAGTPLANESDHATVPLFGLGLTYEVADKTEIYANASESYRPKTYTQAVPTGALNTVPNDLQESKAVQYEVGFRGHPMPWASWDVSGFFMDFDDQIGTTGTTVGNVGRAQYAGAELATEVDFIGISDAANGTQNGQTYGALAWYTATTYLDAQFVSGPLDGRTPAYAADLSVKTGVTWTGPKDVFRFAFLGTMVDDTYANDTNTAQYKVPAYMVWDLTGQVRVYKDIVTLKAGLNNVFNEDYYSRVRADGIDPALARNFYVGVDVGWKF